MLTGPIGQSVIRTVGFDGEIDEVAIYNTSLTATQVASHYAAR